MKTKIYRATVVTWHGTRINIKVEGDKSLTRKEAKADALRQARQFVKPETKISVERMYLDY